MLGSWGSLPEAMPREVRKFPRQLPKVASEQDEAAFIILAKGGLDTRLDLEVNLLDGIGAAVGDEAGAEEDGRDLVEDLARLGAPKRPSAARCKENLTD